ncbi:MAG TPA: penicillin acylase family protein [Chitinophagaceae bacterium]|nr:penicillin acylase family protein [Chitinophagaceae bacterium]HQZ75455.1 penicillin acylase family protein [Chitinophagaceae bacterium]
MRIVPFAVSAVVSAGLIFALNKQWGTIPPMGKFLSPQHGFWQNAEPAGQSFDAELNFPELKGKAEVYFDERLVPHVFAENDEDLYFIQGYLHAKFRLFQIDLQTKAAAGRASEIAGEKAVNYDKQQRRLGMVYAAENAMLEIEKDPTARKIFDAYTNGINAYIINLKESELPIEYKLLNFKPEKWSNLRSALLLKMMAKDLSSGTENDLANTNAKSIFLPEELKMLYPQVPDSLVPIIPKGTVFDAPGIIPVQPATVDSLYFGKKDTVTANEIAKPDINNGSNNWVVAGSKTASGAPILCNDPHLELSLPSIWYEMQLQTPGSNAYGVSLPGAPFVIIGFNDSIAWGVTNAQRDVKDYYEIKFRDETKQEYWFNGKWEKTIQKPELIKVKGGKDVLDTVAYTLFGPVMFDESFSNDFSNKRNLAVRWVAHDPSNEGMTFYKLNRAANYDDYAEAIRTFQCPGQNFIFASKTGDIAIWQQGKFPARWNRQGLYIMPGEDSSYMWQGFIPQPENPHAKNPERGFLESANQRPVDSTYPYFIPGSYITPRAITIENKLAAMSGITPKDMMALHGNYFNTLAEDVRSTLVQYVNETVLNATEKKYLAIIKNWDLMASPDSKGQTVYQCWWDSLEVEIWKDDLARVSPQAPWPEEQTTMELLKKDSALQFIDNINTPQKETLYDAVTTALKKASADLATKEAEGKLEWTKFKNPTVYHLLKDALPAFARKGLNVGGNGNIVNAVTHSHGPSWRMIVHLTNQTEAYGVYPGGQSGNPGSRFYDDYIDKWVAGEYNKLWFMREGDKTDKNVKWVMKFGNSN